MMVSTKEYSLYFMFFRIFFPSKFLIIFIQKFFLKFLQNATPLSIIHLLVDSSQAALESDCRSHS